MRHVGGHRKMGMNSEMKNWAGRWPKRARAFEEWLQRRDRVTYNKYRAQRVVVKRADAKEWRTGDGESDWGMISRVTKRCFGKR